MAALNSSPTLPPLASTAFLRVSGPDQQGIVAAFTTLISGHGCNILSSEQHTDRNDLQSMTFFQRTEFDIGSMRTDKVTLQAGIDEVATRMNMKVSIDWPKLPSVCIFVSKYEHCLWELLLRYRAGELPCTIALIVSNHEDLRHIADTFGIRFEVFKITKDTKPAQEAKEIELMKSLDIELVVLARYMQIISDDFCNAFLHKVINIHHSFLPAFIGGKPYHRAFDRGVKLIGATAHYATADLDEGPILEQDIKRISHRDTVDDLVRKGRQIEKEVLVRAVKKHLQREVIVEGNKCVIFGD